MRFTSRLALPVTTLCVAGFVLPAQAQTSRFTLRAEPDVIPANGVSTTSIFVQVPQRGAISPTGVVRFATTAGVIESQAQLSGGVARVLLRSANAPGTAVVTAFVGSSREAITIEFSEDNGVAERYLEIEAPYTAYGQGTGVVTTAGKSTLTFGDTIIESDVRLDVDLYAERVWAQGNKGGITIRHGKGSKAKQLQGERLFYDLRRKKGVIRRAEGDLTNTATGARQEFIGVNFDVLPPKAEVKIEPESPANDKDRILNPLPPTAPLVIRDGVDVSTVKTGEEPVAHPETPIAVPEGETKVTTPETIRPEITESEATAKAETTESEPEVAVKTEEPAHPESVTPGSLADVPAPLEGSGLLVTPLITKSKAEINSGLAPIPEYDALGEAKLSYEPQITELPVPVIDQKSGYWVTSRRMRVFPRDEVQFEKATVYFNGGKAFGAPIYAIPLDGSFNPTTDMFAFNSSGGLSVKVPVYYQASRSGTGSLTFRNEPGGGFGTQRSGPSLELNQQYWLNPNSQGKVSVDSIGSGAWNLNAQHELKLNSTTEANFYLNMPRHRDLFARAAVTKDLSKMQIGLEAFLDRPEDEQENVRGQFFARMRPKSLGKSGWSYNLGFNALAVKNVAYQTVVGGGGVGTGNGAEVVTRYRSLLGQTLTASLQSPQLSPGHGSTWNANIFTPAFNYSNDRRVWHQA